MCYINPRLTIEIAGKDEHEQNQRLSRDKELILIDASWDRSKRASIGIMCYDAAGRLKRAESKFIETFDAFHMEAKALL
jgi:hypothetical protein